MRLLEIIRDRIWTEQYLYSQGASPGGILALWDAIRTWWRSRPRLEPCLYCGQPCWWNEIGEGPYCDNRCAYYGPARYDGKDEIPF